MSDPLDYREESLQDDKAVEEGEVLKEGEKVIYQVVEKDVEEVLKKEEKPTLGIIPGVKKEENLKRRWRNLGPKGLKRLPASFRNIKNQSGNYLKKDRTELPGLASAQ